MKENEFNDESVFTKEDLKYINEPFTKEDLKYIKSVKCIKKKNNKKTWKSK